MWFLVDEQATTITEEHVELCARQFHHKMYNWGRARYRWGDMRPEYRSEIREVVRFALGWERPESDGMDLRGVLEGSLLGQAGEGS